jgi:hypothetical protein
VSSAIPKLGHGQNSDSFVKSPLVTAIQISLGIPNWPSDEKGSKPKLGPFLLALQR